MMCLDSIMKKILILSFLIFLSASALAENIRFKNGNILVGKILDIAEHDIRVDTHIGFPRYYYYDQIFSIDGLSVEQFKSIYYQKIPETIGKEYFISSNTEKKYNDAYIKNFEKDIKRKIKNSLEKESLLKNNQEKNKFLGKVKIIADIDKETLTQEETHEHFNEQTNHLKDKNDFVKIKGTLRITQEIDFKNISKKNRNVAGQSENFKSDVQKRNVPIFDASERVNLKIIKEKNKSYPAQGMDEKYFFQLLVEGIKQILKSEFFFLKGEIKKIINRFPWLFGWIISISKNAFNFYIQKCNPKIIWFIFILILFFFYLTYSYLLETLAIIFDIKSTWIAWIPFFQEILVIRMSRKSLWWGFFYFVPFLRFLNIIFLWGNISRSLGKSHLYGLLMIIPGINLFVIWYFSHFYREILCRIDQ